MTKNASTLAARDRRHASRAEERALSEQLLRVGSELCEVEERMDGLRAEIEMEDEEMEVEVECVGACELEEEEVEFVGLLDAVEIEAAVEQLREELRVGVLDDIKMGIAMPIIEGCLGSCSHEHHSHEHQDIDPRQHPTQQDWLASLPPNLTPEEFGRLLKEQQQQPGPVPPQGSKHLGQDPVLITTSSQVATERGNLRKTSSGDGTGSQLTRNPRIEFPQPPGGGSDYYAEIDHFHKYHGLPPLADCHNGMVEVLYGKCKLQQHQLRCLLDPTNRQKLRQRYARWTSRESVQDGCIPVKGMAVGIDYLCPDCGEHVKMSLTGGRLAALVAEDVTSL